MVKFIKKLSQSDGSVKADTDREGNDPRSTTSPVELASDATTRSGQARSAEKSVTPKKGTKDSIVKSIDENELAKAESEEHAAAEKAYIDGLREIKALGLDRDLQSDAARALGERFAQKYGVAALRDLERRLR